jgi:excisionase family DNA binding protein
MAGPDTQSGEIIRAPYPDLLTKRETAQYLRMCERTLDRLRKGKAIRHILVCGQIRFRLADIHEYLERRTIKEVTL